MGGRHRKSSYDDSWRFQQDPQLTSSHAQKHAAQEYRRRRNSFNSSVAKAHVDRLVRNRKRKSSNSGESPIREPKHEKPLNEVTLSDLANGSPHNVAYVDPPNIDIIMVTCSNVSIENADIFKPLSDEEKEDLIQYCINLLFPDHCFYDYIHYENSILLSSAQIEDIHNVLLENVFCDEDLCYEIKDLCIEDFLECCFTNRVLSRILTQLRFEKQYHLSSRALILKSVCNIIPCICKEVYDHLYCSIIDFEENERWLPREDGQETSNGFSTLKSNQCGHIHRLVELWSYFVNHLQEKKELFDHQSGDYPISCLTLLPSYKKETYKLLQCLLAFLKTRFTICKYSEICIRGTNTLLSLYPEYCSPILTSIYQKWPIANSDKEVAYIHFLENILCTIPMEECYSLHLSLKPLFKKVFKALESNQIAVCHRILLLLQNQEILYNYILKDDALITLYKNALYHSLHSWDAYIRELSEQQFDMLLDFM